MRGLKPCPWCGNERPYVMIKTPDPVNTGAQVRCTRCDAMGPYMHRYARRTPQGELVDKVAESAAEAWNSYRETTCRNEEASRNDPCEKGLFKCSECGVDLQIDEYDFMANRYAFKAKYCPRCGRRVDDAAHE